MKKLILPCALLLAGYVLGAYSFAHAIWPTNVLTCKHEANVAKALSKNFDELGAYSNLKGKTEVIAQLRVPPQQSYWFYASQTPQIILKENL